MMDNNRLALLKLLNSSLFNVQPDLPGNTDWDAVYKEACDQTVVALGAPAVPPEKAEKWQQTALQSKAQYMRILYEQSNLIKLFEDNGIKLVIFKGCAAAMYYPKPFLRTMGDIDFLVPQGDFDAAQKLLSENGYEFLGDYEDGRDYAYQKGGVVFELHRHYSDYRVDIEDILINGMKVINTRELNGHKFPAFSDEINGLIILDHIRHHIYGGLGIRQIIDWVMFLNSNMNNDDCINRLLDLAKSANLEKFCKILTKMCVIYLNLPDNFPWCRDADETTAKKLMDTVFESGNFGRKKPYVYRPLDSLTQNVRQKGLFKFLQTAGLQNWNACQKHKFLRPFAWIYQIFRFIKRGFAALFRGENLKKDMDAGNEKVDFYNKLGI